ncbi:unnamed protein product [Laminaria digitata]
MNEVGMIQFLIERKADPNGPVHREMPVPRALAFASEERFTHHPGERALHIAVVRGNVEVVRMLKRAGADPNATDKRGRTPLLTACGCLEGCVEIVRLLLEAGANPALAEKENGYAPLHLAAQNGHTEFIDMLCKAAPSVLSTYATAGETPLFMACATGHEMIASRLLSLGAMQVVPPDKRGMLPLAVAVKGGHMGVVRVMIDRGIGIRAIGGRVMFPNALYSSVRHHQARILCVLLGAHGEERRTEWANTDLSDQKLLHCGAGFCSPGAVSVLLRSGADEAALDSQGRVPRDTIGADPRMKVKNYRKKEIAIRRMLQRGPAYRARSWAWRTEEAKDGGGCGDQGVVLSSAQAPKTPAVGVRIFRPKNDRKFFARAVGR